MAQREINNGTVAGDGTGEILFSAFEKTNDNFTELYGDKLENVTYINSVDDFPAPVGNVIELVQTPNESRTYIIASKTIDIGVNTFSVTDGAIVIRGEHRTGSQISSTSNSAPLFYSRTSSLFHEFIGVQCASTDFLDFDGGGVGTLNTYASQNLILFSCLSGGTIANTFVTSLRVATVVSATNSGFTWSGACGQLNMSNFLALGWANTLLDLSTATFDIVDISVGNRFISPSGTTTLSGLASNGNLNADGRGIVENSLFNGLGTSLSGITTDDTQWFFGANIFTDGTTKNSEVKGDTYLSASQTVSVGLAGTYYGIGGSNWLSDISRRFTTTTSGQLTYIGKEGVDVIITGAATLEKSGGGSDNICMKVAINGVVQDKSLGCTQNTTPTQITSTGLFELNNGDVVQLYVANEDSATNIIVTVSSLVIASR